MTQSFLCSVDQHLELEPVGELAWTAAAPAAVSALARRIRPIYDHLQVTEEGRIPGNLL